MKFFRSWLAIAVSVGVLAIGLKHGFEWCRAKILQEMAMPGNGFFSGHARDLMERLNTPGVLDALQRADLQPNDSLLEICIGYGSGIQEALLYPNVSVTGVDVSEESLSSSRTRSLDAMSEGRLTLHHGSAHSMPFLQSDAFDKVFHFNCCYFWRDLEETLREIRRVLKPGGRMISGTKFRQILPETHHKSIFPNREERAYQEAIRAAGFEKVSRQEVQLASACTGRRAKSGCHVDPRMAYELTIAYKPLA